MSKTHCSQIGKSLHSSRRDKYTKKIILEGKGIIIATKTETEREGETKRENRHE